MFSTEKKLLSGLCASVFALSAMAAATTVVSQPFATATTDVTTITGTNAGTWTGYGEVKATDATYSATSLPISSGTALGNALSVDGYVQCAAETTANKPATVDMMIQIAKPDEDLAMPSSETTTDIQIAVGVDTDGTLKVYSPGKGSTAAWQSLGDTIYTEGSWHRVAFTFDYAKGTCQVSLDGVALVSANGYITADPQTSPTTAGSWYKLNKADATNLASVKVVGSTAIDEVLVQYGETDSEVQPVPSGTVNDVPASWLLAQGVTSATAAAPDGSGMTNAEKYQAGMAVMDGQTYKIEAMAMAGATGAVKATLTVPAMTAPNGYQNVIKYGSAPDALTESKVIDAGATTVELNVSKAASGVTKIYYKMVSEKTSAQ